MATQLTPLSEIGPGGIVMFALFVSHPYLFFCSAFKHRKNMLASPKPGTRARSTFRKPAASSPPPELTHLESFQYFFFFRRNFLSASRPRDDCFECYDPSPNSIQLSSVANERVSPRMANVPIWPLFRNALKLKAQSSFSATTRISTRGR